MALLININPIASPHIRRFKALRQQCYTAESWERCPKSLGFSADTYDSLLWSVLIYKLSQELRLIISHHVREDEWILGAIMDVTEREVTAIERERERERERELWETLVRDSGGQWKNPWLLMHFMVVNVEAEMLILLAILPFKFL